MGQKMKRMDCLCSAYGSDQLNKFNFVNKNRMDSDSQNNSHKDKWQSTSDEFPVWTIISPKPDKDIEEKNKSVIIWICPTHVYLINVQKLLLIKW